MHSLDTEAAGSSIHLKSQVRNTAIAEPSSVPEVPKTSLVGIAKAKQAALYYKLCPEYHALSQSLTDCTQSCRMQHGVQTWQ